MSLLRLDRAPTLVGVAAAPFIADVLKNVGLRRDWRRPHVAPRASSRRAPWRWRGGAYKALADRSRLGWRSLATTALVTAAVAAGATVAVFTVPELAVGRALFDPDRSTTFFSDTPTLVLDVPSAVEAEAIDRRGAYVHYEAHGRSPEGFPVTLRCRPASGTLFGIRRTLVTCTATARAEGSPPVVVRKTFGVIVADTTAPAIALPSELSAEATSPAGAVVDYHVSATDAVDTAPTLNCAPHSGSSFAVGTTTVECTAIDGFGNRAMKSLTISVVDTTPPRFEVPGDGVLTEEAVSREGAKVNYTVSATDAVDTKPVIDCDRDSGSIFPIGTTTVECKASDRAGNAETGTLSINVVDQPPIIKAPPRIVKRYTSANGTLVPARISAWDMVDGRLTPQCTPPLDQPFAVGVTRVTCRVSDSNGHAATRTLSVIIIDRVAPRITAPRSVSTSAPYGERSYRVAFRISAYDEIDKSVPVVCTPPAGSEFPVGETTTVSCSARDRSGNTASARFSVTVRATPG
jgi:hypothetical protein